MSALAIPASALRRWISLRRGRVGPCRVSSRGRHAACSMPSSIRCRPRADMRTTPRWAIVGGDRSAFGPRRGEPASKRGPLAGGRSTVGHADRAAARERRGGPRATNEPKGANRRRHVGRQAHGGCGRRGGGRQSEARRESAQRAHPGGAHAALGMTSPRRGQSSVSVACSTYSTCSPCSMASARSVLSAHRVLLRRENAPLVS